MKSNWREILRPCSLQEVKWWLSWPLLFISYFKSRKQKRHNIAGKIPVVDQTQSTRGCMRRNVDTGEYAASSLVRKYHDHYYTTKDRSLSVNNTENEKIQCLLLPDGLFAVRRSIQSFSDFSVVWSYLL